MVYLHMKASHFGINAESVRAPYTTLEEAEAQAENNIANNTQQPLRIVDTEGNILVNFE